MRNRSISEKEERLRIKNYYPRTLSLHIICWMEEINSSVGCGARRRRRGDKYLPGELQEKILLGLPVKSLVRFESVCKTWLSMFHSRGFIDSYGQCGCCAHLNSPLDIHTTSSADLCTMIPGLIHPCEITNDQECVFFMMGPLNGVYCVACYLCESSGEGFSILTGRIALCNPATHDYKFTNPFPRRFHSQLSDISSKPCLLCFGFGNVNVDHKSNSLDYRVVVIFHSGGTQNPSFVAFVYSVRKRQWKKILDYEPGKRNLGKREAKEAFSVQGRRIIHINNPLEGCPQRFFKGCYYWMAICEGRTYNVLSFNFVDRSFKLIGGPPHYSNYVAAEDERFLLWCDVFVLHDHLAVVYLFSVESSSGVGSRTVEVCVWMMMEYGVEESWTKIYTIYPNLCSEIHKLYGIHYQALTGGGIRIERLLFKTQSQIVSCDDAGYKVIHDCDPVFKVCWNTPGISTYTHTLERP